MRSPHPTKTLSLLIGCRKREIPADAPRSVVAIRAHASAPAAALSVPGEIAARFSTLLSFRVGGKLIKRCVHLGNTVSAGQTVAWLDPANARSMPPVPLRNLPQPSIGSHLQHNSSIGTAHRLPRI